MVLHVGVLAVQGAVSEHEEALQRAAQAMGTEVEVTAVRTPDDLARVHGLVMPGGESTTISRLLRSGHLQAPLLERAGRDLAVFGTCAGLILLCSRATRDVEEKDIHLLGLLEGEVDRNAFGRQRESFEAVLDVVGMGRVPAVFIRAPAITATWGDTKELARFRDHVVAAQHGLVLGTSFHPELTGDIRFHERFLALVQRAAGESGSA